MPDERVYDAIMNAVLGHRLPAGTRLIEAPLCRVFGVTRGVLRRVFVRLAHEGVAELQLNRGAIIAMHNLKEAQEIFEARMMLELGSIPGAVRKTDKRALRQLRDLVGREHQQWESGDWRDWVRLSGEFHLQLAELNRNAVVGNYLRALVARSSLLIGLYETPKQHACGAGAHTLILDAIEDGDAPRAAHLLEAHLREYAHKLLVAGTVSAEIDLEAVFSEVSGQG